MDERAAAYAEVYDGRIVSVRPERNAHHTVPLYRGPNTELLEAAQAVVARWDTPNWKDAEPTAAVIARLRNAVAEAVGNSQ